MDSELPSGISNDNSDRNDSLGQSIITDIKTPDSDSTKVENNLQNEAPLSKKALKKRKKMEQRLLNRKEWKLKRKQREKERKARRRNATEIEKPIIKSMSLGGKCSIVIDLSYNDLMTEKDLMQCTNQLARCYAANRRSSKPVQLHFCNFNGKVIEAMVRHDGYEHWDVHFHPENYTEVFEIEKMVYLTSEARDVLESIEEDKIYIIGGLVDHNSHKGVSFQKAATEGLKTARLPIRSYLPMKSRAVLAINHVMLDCANGLSWKDSFLKNIPQRMLDI